MSWRAVDSVMKNFERKSCQPREYLLCIAIAHSYSETRGDSYPKRQTLAARVGVSERQVSTLANHLIAAEDIFVIERGRGRGHSTVYGLAAKYVAKTGTHALPLLDRENGKSKAVKREQALYESDPQRFPQREERAEERSLPNSGNGPLADSLTKVLSSIPSTPTPSERKDEPAWRQELRDLYPGITDTEIIRVEAKVCKGQPTRSHMLNVFKKNPPRKIGDRKRKRKLDYEAELAASMAKADQEWDGKPSRI